MIISLIAALSIDNIIGVRGSIPWHLSIDLDWFKCNTINKPVIMGRKTFDTIGKPLPKRKNIVMSRCCMNYDGVTYVKNSIHALIAAGKVNEVMVIGGGEIYTIFLPYSNRLYLTYIDVKIDGDTFFPDYKKYKWRSIFRKFYHADEKNIYNCCFEILERSSLY